MQWDARDRIRKKYKKKGIESRLIYYKTRDAFTKREKGMEDYAIREREKEKAKELLAKIKLQEESLAKIKEHLFVFPLPFLTIA